MMKREERKDAYVSHYGLTAYFFSLVKQVSEANKRVLLYGETLNRKSQHNPTEKHTARSEELPAAKTLVKLVRPSSTYV